LAEFLSKATGTAVDWVQMPGMKVVFINYFLICINSTSSLVDSFCKHFFSHLNESFKFIGSLVRIRLGSLPFHKGAVEWQLEPAVL
jgi:hypothetical protein